MFRSLLYLLIIIGVTGLLTIALVWTGPESRATLQPPPPPRVITTEVREIDFQPVTRLMGEFRPRRSSRLHFEVSGQVSDRLVEPGQQVTAGDVLLKLDSGDYKDAAMEARAALQLEREALERDRRLLELTREQVSLQQQEVDRISKLGRQSLASQSNYDAALQSLLTLQAEAARLRHSIDSAAARLDRQRAAYNQAQRKLERARLTAPFTATVDAVEVEVGDYVTPGQMAVRLVQLEELDLALDAPASAVTSLSLGQTIRVNADNETRAGRIVALAADPDPLTHTYALRIRVSGEDLYPGQLAQAELPGRQYDNARVVPATAILRSEGETYVFAIEDEVLRRVPVNIRQRYKEWRVVDGVATGRTIVAQDVAALADGQQVTVQ